MYLKKLFNLNYNIEERISAELNTLNQMYSHYSAIKNIFSDLMETKITTLSDNFSKEELNKLLSKSESYNSDLHLVLSLMDIAKNALSDALKIYKENDGKLSISKQITYYNYIYDDLNDVISKFDNEFSEFSDTFNDSFENIAVVDNTSNLSDSGNEIENVSDSNNENDVEEVSCGITDNDTLVISELSNKVLLPYKAKDIQQILDDNKCNSAEEVIEKLYTLPLSNFKNSMFARFREGYKLIMQKENGSFSQAIDLAFELMFNSSLHPAIIHACKNLKELDFFLDCLESNKLSEFTCFKVKFEIAPLVVKQESAF